MPRGGLDRQTIVLKAAELADLDGLGGVTLAWLAQELNVKTPSLYNHIGGLPDLLHHLALYAVRELRDRLARAAVGKSGEEAIRAIGVAYVAFARTRPGVYEATLAAPDASHRDLQAAAAEVLGIILDVLKSVGVEGDSAIHAVRGFRSLAHGFVSLEAKGGFGMALDRDESFARLADVFISGLRLVHTDSRK